MHREALTYVVANTEGHWDRVVEFGGRDINGSVRPRIDAGEYLSIDLVDGPGVDLVADATKWDGRGGYGLVVCCELLEHTDQIAEILASAGRALRAGGTMVLTAACDPRAPHSAVDGSVLREGEYYRNLDEGDLVVDWGVIEDVEWDRVAGDVRATIVKGEPKRSSSAKPKPATKPAKKRTPRRGTAG